MLVLVLGSSAIDAEIFCKRAAAINSSNRHEFFPGVVDERAKINRILSFVSLIRDAPQLSARFHRVQPGIGGMLASCRVLALWGCFLLALCFSSSLLFCFPVTPVLSFLAVECRFERFDNKQTRCECVNGRANAALP